VKQAEVITDITLPPSAGENNFFLAMSLLLITFKTTEPAIISMSSAADGCNQPESCGTGRGLSHLYPVDVGSASPTSFSYVFDDAFKEQINNYHSVFGSQAFP